MAGHDGSEFGTLGRGSGRPRAPLHACDLGRLLGEGGGDEPETTRRPLLPACASTFLKKWTWQRCQVAHSAFETAAAMMPLWSSETTGWTPRKSATRKLAQERRPASAFSCCPCPTRQPGSLA
jgi:hypothetical protein